MLSQKIKTYLLDHCQTQRGDPVQVSRQKIAQGVGARGVTSLRGALDDLEAQGDIVKIGGHSVALSNALAKAESLHCRDETSWPGTEPAVNVGVRRSRRLMGRSSTRNNSQDIEQLVTKIEELTQPSKSNEMENHSARLQGVSADCKEDCKLCVAGQTGPYLEDHGWAHPGEHSHCVVTFCINRLKKGGVFCGECHHPTCTEKMDVHSYFCAKHSKEVGNGDVTVNGGRSNLRYDLSSAVLQAIRKKKI